MAPFTIGGVKAEPFEALRIEVDAGIQAVAGQPQRRTLQVRTGRDLELTGNLSCAAGVSAPLLIDDVSNASLSLSTYHAGGGPGAVLRDCQQVRGRLVSNGRLEVHDSQAVRVELERRGQHDQG